jgi:hypothetical protein
MRQIPDQLRSRNLVPFKKRRGKYNIPGLASEHDVLIDRVDADLSSEERGFVRHYLGYADIFLKNAEENEPTPQEQFLPTANQETKSPRVEKDPSDQAA